MGKPQVMQLKNDIYGKFRAMSKSTLKKLGLDVRNRSYHFVDAFEDQRRLLEHCERPFVVLDVGANDGQTIAEYRNILGADVTIHSFEPTPEIFERLSKRTAADSKTHVHNVAVSDSNGTATFHVTSMSLLNSLLPLAADDATYATGAKVVARISVPTVTLDSFCEEHRLGRVSILKMDIQGAELLALRGAARMLSQARIDVVFLEVCFSDMYEGQVYLPEIMGLLRKDDYKLYGLYDFARELNGTLGWCNAIFVSPETYAKLPKTFWRPRT
jgi:FkbM family methyltransferase